MTLADEFGNIDIYLFDQLRRGNITPEMRVLDAGCGEGRNLVYPLRHGYEVFAIDENEDAVRQVRRFAKQLAPHLPENNFRVSAIEAMPFPKEFTDAVICNSVLHFAGSDEQFGAMVAAMWRVLRPGGILFCRLASTIGMDFERAEGRLHRLPGGAVWYLVDEALLLRLTETLGGTLVDPLKTTVVQGSRCMTTWVVRKP